MYTSQMPAPRLTVRNDAGPPAQARRQTSLPALPTLYEDGAFTRAGTPDAQSWIIDVVPEDPRDNEDYMLPRSPILVPDSPVGRPSLGLRRSFFQVALGAGFLYTRG